MIGDSAHVAATLHVILAAQWIQPAAVASDMAGEQRQIDQCEHVVHGVVMLGDSERPADDGAICFGVS